MSEEKKIKGRHRFKPVKRWDHKDETAIISYLKQNRFFEKPTARIYYSKFLEEYGIDVCWKLVLYKVRNMRTVYRRAKEYHISRREDDGMDSEVMRTKMLKMCWYVDDFDVLFPNEMDNFVRSNLQLSCTDDESNKELIFNNPTEQNDKHEHRGQSAVCVETTQSSNSTDQELSPQQDQSMSCCYNENEYKNSTTTFNEQFLSEKPAVFYFPKSIERDILAIQRGKLNFKKQTFDKGTHFKQQELNLAREQLSFEQEKFRLEIALKEKNLESQEKLKIMEFQIKERIAMKELELAEKLALKSVEKPQKPKTSFTL